MYSENRGERVEGDIRPLYKTSLTNLLSLINTHAHVFLCATRLHRIILGEPNVGVVCVW